MFVLKGILGILIRKILVSVKFSVRNSGAGNGVRQFYGHLEKCVLSAGKTMSRKIPLFWGGGGWGGGGSADFIFMGARIFLKGILGGSSKSFLRKASGYRAIPCIGNGRNIVSRVLFRKRELSYSLSSAANSVSSAKNSVSSLWHTNKRLRGTHWALSPELSEGAKKLTEFGVWNRALRNFIWPISNCISASVFSQDRAMCLSRFLGRGCDEALFSEKKGFSMKRGEAIQWRGNLVRISTGKAIQWRGSGHSVNCRTLKSEKVAVLIPFPKISS